MCACPPNQSHQDVGPEEELHCTHSGSCAAADVSIPRLLHAHATGLVLCQAHQCHIYMELKANHEK